MRDRKRERFAGYDPKNLSLTNPSDHMPAYAPSLTTPSAPATSPSLNLQLRDPSAAMSMQSGSPMSMSMNIQAPQEKPNFFTKDLGHGIKVWHAILMGVGGLLAGVGIYKTVASPPKVSR